MYHGVKFGPDGTCVAVPGQDVVPASLKVRTYPIVEKHRFVWIWLGDAARADVSLIPDLNLLDEPERRLYCGHLDYEAHYLLITDNLLDLSHLGFLHEKTLGRRVDSATDNSPTRRFPAGSGAKSIPHGVRVDGWLPARTVFLPKRVWSGDSWSCVDFFVPGIYKSYGRVYPSGMVEECEGRAPPSDRASLCDAFSIQAVTPISRRKTRYFYSLGHRASDMEVAEADAMWQVVLDAFAEDLRMIQAQQRIIDSSTGGRMGGIGADRGLVMFRNMMKRLIAAEGALAAGAEQGTDD